MTEAATKTRALLLDIEGTVTPISFVHDVLFPFARTHVRSYLERYSAKDDVQKDIEALAREHALDQENDKQPPRLENSVSPIEATITYINRLIECDRKSPALKSLQGKIWEQGYRDGILKAPLFDDVVPNLQRLRRLGMSIAIFSSGSVLAQKLLFAYTDSGDHTDLIDQYFDTGVGSKINSSSYQEIARQLQLLPRQMVFVSDVTNELAAARHAGMPTFLCLRTGNQPQSNAEQFQVIESFSQILSGQ